LVWHRLDQVAPILEKTLKVKVPDTTVLMAAIVKRHHIIHRAGLTPEGEQVEVSAADVRELRQQVLAFATSIQGQLSNGS